MQISPHPHGQMPPVAVGGVGGSGTRLIATLMMQGGFYMGRALNRACDNLWFTVLLRRSSWFRTFPSGPEIREAIGLFRVAMTTGLAGRCTPRQAALLERIGRDLEGQDHPEARQLRAALDALRQSQGPDPDAADRRWGWKEPNTHIFLPWLAKELPDLRYVHVIRNGLDMAFSANQNQLRNWGPHILPPEALDPDRPNPARSLDYWLAANRRAIRIGRNRFKDRFFLLGYDRLCLEPQTVLPRLFAFLGIEADLDAAVKQISPGRIGRHRQQDPSVFTSAQHRAVANLMAMAD